MKEWVGGGLGEFIGYSEVQSGEELDMVAAAEMPLFQGSPAGGQVRKVVI